MLNFFPRVTHRWRHIKRTRQRIGRQQTLPEQVINNTNNLFFRSREGGDREAHAERHSFNKV